MALVRKSAPNLATVHKPFPYQSEAFVAIRDLEYSAVFHEQGLGKTKIAIDVALHWLEHQIVDSVVIVTKKGLVANWQKEFRIHTKVKPKVFTGDRADNHYSFHSTSPFFITHYEAVKSEAERFELFAKSRRIGMILDEAHKIKNPEANITHAFHELAPLFNKRLILTGSPIANRPYDLWAQVWFLDQGAALGHDFRKFKSMLDIPRDESSSASQGLGVDVFEDELGQLFPKIKPFSVRETKDTAGIHLPSKHYRQVTARFESDQRKMYEAIRDEMRLEVLKDGLIEEDVSDDLLKRLLRLVQVASNPALVDERYIAEPGKVQPLCELVGKISANGEKVIIWTSFVDNVGWLAKLFNEYCPVRVHGGMAMKDRQRSIDAFLEEDRKSVV